MFFLFAEVIPVTFGLIVLDGWGHSKKKEKNAVLAAKTPNFDRLWDGYPHTLLKAHGEAVGLPKGFQGGSEVGHLHLGAGRLIPQKMVEIDGYITDGSFFRNRHLVSACKRKRVHFIGLLSDQGVHSHIRHLKALLKMRPDAFVHAFLDGRDTPPKSALKYVRQFRNIATVSGRYYAMDRDGRWKRIQKAFDCMTKGKGREAKTAEQAVLDAYKRGETDEFVSPTLVNPDGVIREGDAVVFFNFRADRARQLTKKFLEETKTYFVSMSEYDKALEERIAFKPHYVEDSLGEVLSMAGKTQLRIAETEKYAHVTFFFSGEREKPFKGEDRVLVRSPRVATYDLKPEMSAYEVTDKLVKAAKKYDFVIINYANGDMVGHTGIFRAAVKAVESVDKCVGKIIPLFDECIILADHGNCEAMTGKTKTSHTLNPVPCILVTERKIKLKKGSLYNIAPTILELMGIKKPGKMADSLVVH